MKQRQADKSLQQYLFRDVNKSQENKKEITLVQLNGQNSSITSSQQDNINSLQSQSSPNKSQDQPIKSIIDNQSNQSQKQTRKGLSYFFGNKNFIVSEQEASDQLDVKSQDKINISQNLPKIWRYNFFSILGWIAKYIRYIRIRIIQFHPEKYLSQFHFDIINDRSYFNKPNDEGQDYFYNIINRDKLALMKQEKNLSSFQKSIIKTSRSNYKYIKLIIQLILNI